MPRALRVVADRRDLDGAPPLNTGLLVPLAAGRPAILREAADRFCKAIEHSPRRFLELHGAQLLPQWQRRHMTPRMPSRREALGRVVRALLEHTDLVSLRVGTPRTDGHVTPPGQHVIKADGSESGLSVETGLPLTRLRRALRDLRRAGYITGPGRGSNVKQPVMQYTNAAGERAYCAFRVIYTFTVKFFERLGMDRRLERQRTMASERRRARARVYAGALLDGRDAARGMRTGSRETRRRDDAGAPTRALATRRPPAALTDADHATLLTVKLGLRRKHPDWGPERLDAEAKRLLGR